MNEATGTIYVANEKNLQVNILSADGTVLGLINKYGAGTGQAIGSPFSVARDEQGNLYVADYTKKLIHVYDSGARWLRSFAPLDQPKGLDVRGDTIYVLSNRKIATYTTNGALISRWGTVGSGDADINSPYLGIAVDAAGRLYIGDSGNHRVKVFNP